MTEKSLEHMLNTDEVSKWLGVAPRTVCMWAECNELPAIKVGRQWRFRRAEIMLWLSQSQSSEPQKEYLAAKSALLAVTNGRK